MANKIRITFLGTGDAIPSRDRNHTAILLNYEKENILFDCGEGTQRQFRKAGLNPCKINMICISHWHGDHVLGLPGIFQTLALSGYKKTLKIYGPRGTRDYIRELFKVFNFANEIKLDVKEIDKAKFFEDKDFYLEAERMSHGSPCNAYIFVKKGKRKIDKKKLLKSKLPAGPLLSRLKEGKDIIYQGKKFKAKNLTFMENEKKISFVFDTNYNDRIIPFAENSDLLVMESSFGSELEERAKEYKHMTAKQDAEIAKKARAKKLVLIHISQRYDKDKKKILNDAKRIFKNSVIVKDLDVLEI